MANIKFKNFARSTLSIGAASGATSLTLASGTGTKFPTLTGAEYFYLTLENASLTREIVKVTARTGDTLTVVRAQDGTTAQAWNAGDVAALRFNAAAIADSVTNVVQQTSVTGSAVIPSGTTGQRDGTPVFGYTRANSTTGQMEWWNGTAWSSIGGGATGSGGDQVFYENDTSVTTSHTINRNSHAVGPISIASGVTLTVATGKRLVVL